MGDVVQAMEDYCRWELDDALVAQTRAWISEASGGEHVRFRNRLEFGTAGLRAEMGAGLDRMNCVTVMQATQGILKYYEELLGEDDLRSSGVAIGYDARRNSELFASITAIVCVRRGVKVYLFDDPKPTPILAYAAKLNRTAFAVMITASHNPKDDNGYKLYGPDFCQIIPPHDQGIQSKIVTNLEPWISYRDASKDEAQAHPLCEAITSDVEHAYLSEVSAKLRIGDAAINSNSARIVYSAFHGVGARLVALAFEKFGLPPYIPVAEQIEPDPEFPTLPFPNPEEAGAMRVAIQCADGAGACLIFANDPDADRFAVAEKQPSGSWKVFSGNETAMLLADWMWLKFGRTQEDPQAAVMISSAVSSAFLGAMASKEHFNFRQALTGFKWLSHVASDCLKEGLCPLLTFEEALGFMLKDVVLDKDGVSTAAVFAELCAETYGEGRSLSQKLERFSELYGCHLGYNGYKLFRDPIEMAKAFQKLRTFSPGRPMVPGGHLISMRDVLQSVDSGRDDGTCDLPAVGGTEFITLRISSGISGRDGKVPDLVLSYRASGTEPKLKFYSELRSSPESQQRARDLLRELVDACNGDVMGQD